MNEENLTYQDFYTINEFAKKLHVHTNTIRRSIKNGRIMAFKFGSDKKSTYRIPHTEIERVILGDLRNFFKKLDEKKDLK